jgi:hypothetical protein
MIASSLDSTFLSLLPNLVEMELDCMDIGAEGTLASPEECVAALQRCSKLTSLQIESDKFTSQHMCALLPSLPALRKLGLYNMEQLESLRCFSRGPITRTLTHLELHDCRHPALHIAELEHLHALIQLRSLILDESFAEPLDALTRRLHSKPDSLLLPKLTEFIYTPHAQ